MENHGRLEQDLNLQLFKYEAVVVTHLTSMFSPRAVGYPYRPVIADFKSPHTTGLTAGFVFKVTVLNDEKHYAHSNGQWT